MVKLVNNISNQIRKAFKAKNNRKDNRTFSALGYTPDELWRHLESQFTDGMSWENMGKNGWHIDHIRPIASFNFDSTEHPEFKECWALENLQPMWEKENISKNSWWNGQRYYYEVEI